VRIASLCLSTDEQTWGGELIAGTDSITTVGSGLSTCMETLPRPISMRSHNKTASKNRLREGRSWGNDLAARPAMTMLKGLPQWGVKSKLTAPTVLAIIDNTQCRFQLGDRLLLDCREWVCLPAVSPYTLVVPPVLAPRLSAYGWPVYRIARRSTHTC
jgi:hypothetical protein